MKKKKKKKEERESVEEQKALTCQTGRREPSPVGEWT
jgi:hypothetical protein